MVYIERKPHSGIIKRFEFILTRTYQGHEEQIIKILQSNNGKIFQVREISYLRWFDYSLIS